jgi:hypothetical protein
MTSLGLDPAFNHSRCVWILVVLSGFSAFASTSMKKNFASRKNTLHPFFRKDAGPLVGGYFEFSAQISPRLSQ